MSDNEFALSQFNVTGDIGALMAHVESPNFVGDDDAGWTLVEMLNSPSFRPCTCGSGVYWSRCGYTDYCG